MAAGRLTYPNKTNNDADPIPIKQWQFRDANQIKSTVNNHADLIDGLGAEVDSIKFEGVKTYQTLADLQAVSPVPDEGTAARVANDPDPDNNGYWAVDGGVWVQDAKNNLIVLFDTVQDLETQNRLNRNTAAVSDLERGGIFRYFGSGSGLVANDGTIFNAADGGFWVRQFSEDLNLKWFGVVGDGVVDDTSAVSNSLGVADGRPLIVDKNAVVRVTSSITYDGNIHFKGGGTFLFDAISAGFEINSVSPSEFFKSENITYDGNSVCIEALKVGNVDSLIINGGAIINYDSDTVCRPLILRSDISTAVITDVLFRDITALADGTVGNTNGAVRAIQITGVVKTGIIQNCTFDNVNNRDGVGAHAYEDADCIAFSGFNDTNMLIDNNFFNNIGKRFVKMQLGTGAVVTISNNRGSSPYTGTPDEVTAADNGMSSAFNPQGGKYVTIENNYFSGGVCRNFVAVGFDTGEVLINNNYYEPEFHNFADGGGTGFALLNSSNASFTGEISGNTSHNNRSGIICNSYTELKISGNKLNSSLTGVIVDSGPGVDISNNYITNTNRQTGETTNGIQIRGNDPYQMSIIGNIIDGFNSAISTFNTANAFSLIVSKNIFKNNIDFNVNKQTNPTSSYSVFDNVEDNVLSNSFKGQDFTIPATSAVGRTTVSVVFPGVNVGDAIIPASSFNTLQSDIFVENIWVSATDEISILVMNHTGNPTTQTTLQTRFKIL